MSLRYLPEYTENALLALDLARKEAGPTMVALQAGEDVKSAIIKRGREMHPWSTNPKFQGEEKSA